MTKNTIIITALFATLLLAGCGTFEVRLEYTATPDQDAIATRAAELMSELPEAGPAPIAAPVGLVYSTEEGLWIIDGDGQAKFLHEDGQSAVLSPDGRQVLFASGNNLGNDPWLEGLTDDIWLLDLDSGETRPVSDTPDILEADFKWWPSRPGVVVFRYVPREEAGPMTALSLGALDLETGEFTHLAEDAGSFALSPDGETIAYDSGQLMLYTWGGKSEAVDLRPQGINNTRHNMKPAWSPDGKRLAWFVDGDLDGKSESWQGGLVVLERESDTAQLLHIYEFVGYGGVAPEIAWSPDGEWLAFQTMLEVLGTVEESVAQLWVLRADGNEERFLGYAQNPIWSPDGRWLAYTQWPTDSDQKSTLDAETMLVEVGVWEPYELELPTGNVVDDWLAIP